MDEIETSDQTQKLPPSLEPSQTQKVSPKNTKKPLILTITGIIIIVGVSYTFLGRMQKEKPTIIELTESKQENPTSSRSEPSYVLDKIIVSLLENNPSLLYAELSPLYKSAWDETNYVASKQRIIDQSGNVTKVEILDPAVINTDPGLRGKHAEATLRLTRQGKYETLNVLLIQEDGEWWFFGSKTITPSTN